MANIHREVVLTESATEVWDRLKDPGQINKWFTYLGPVQYDEAAATRTCALGDAELQELILDIDNGRRRVAYAIVESPLGLGHHTASMQVLDHDGGSKLVWTHDFLPESARAPLEGAVDDTISLITAS